MTADTDSQSDETQATDSERPRYRELSEDALRRILTDHRRWIETKRGTPADLRRFDLQGTDLHGANLQDADLRGANLQGANLHGAYLYRADLRHADLRRADLGFANLQGANLRNANLREADLSDAQLTTSHGLLVGSLAGADLTNAGLPEAIAAFEGLDHEGETSRNARRMFLAMLLGCLYAWLAVATTTDARLLTNSASSPLPIIQTEIPIAVFYWAAPIILLGLYVYLHLYLQRLWRGLAALPAVFPDGKPLDEKAYPWLLNGLVRAHFARLRDDRPALSRLESFVSIFAAWWVVPLTAVLFWIRYLPRHDWLVTNLHILLIIVAAGFGSTSYWLARSTLRGHPTRFRWTKSWHKTRTYLAAAALALGLALAAISYGAIEGAILVGANLQGANLRRADLFGANLGGANLQGADLRRAINLIQEQLDGACGDEATKPPSEELTIRTCPEEQEGSEDR